MQLGLGIQAEIATGGSDLVRSRPDGLATPYVSGDQNKKGKY